MKIKNINISYSRMDKEQIFYLGRKTPYYIYRFSHVIKKCEHSKVPWIKSVHNNEIIQIGQCPDCGVHLQELH